MADGEEGVMLGVGGQAVGLVVALALLGAIGAWTGGAGIFRPMLRVVFWGAVAMGATAAIGRLVGHAV